MKDPIVQFLGIMVLLTLMMAIARQLSEQSVSGPYAEAFQLYNPADASLVNPRAPYSLLSLPVKETPGDFTAKTCYDADFLSQSNKTGNFIQRTNNFPHLGPDSCSSPHTEFVNSFYTKS